ncbi:alpha/beta hydrolase family protein [Streptomyces marincola]|uniref:alpha/beta hydrolase family protein n=1 Tax=Streptomyces marincola TaxID=2878388 RepID=UPI001CF3C9E3|nr:alpha/beta fold hydrolase [Streptomyces marincola]UCM88137.1 alpha/beta fold hydrolase [Streptomyces marincola]
MTAVTAAAATSAPGTGAVPGAAPGAAMPRLWPLLTSLRSRFSFRFSTTGRAAAALVADGRGVLFCEFWDLADEAGTAPTCRVVPGFSRPARAEDDPASLPSDALPFDDGSVLVVARTGLELVTAAGARTAAGRLPFRPVVTAPAPGGRPGALFLGRDDAGAWSAWWWDPSAAGARRVGGVPPLTLPRGGGWLDEGATRFALNAPSPAGPGPTAPAVLTVPEGRLEPLPVGDPSEHDMVWHTVPRTGESLLVGTDGSAHALRLSGPGGTRRLTAADALTGSVTPLALDASGTLLALHERVGQRDRLTVLDTVRDALLDLPERGDTLYAHATWTETGSGTPGLLAFVADAGRPARVAGTAPGAEGWTHVTDGTEAGDHDAYAPGHLERLPGAAGDIEAVVCGHQDWRTARGVVLCLHGGPADHWALKFSLLFQFLADLGLTVIAPNPRGSTGYGDAFHRTVVGAWGGPDLDDVLAIARHLRAERRTPEGLALYGASYGAFLALLAAATEPELWSRTLAVAPMLGGRRLHPEADASVRALIDRLDGHAVVDDHLGPRDPLARLSRITAPLAVIHGADDPTIPPGQSRRLVAELRRLGRRPGTDFHHVEVPGAGHSPLDGSAELHHTAALFLAEGVWTGPATT